MGSLCVVISESGDPELQGRLEGMLARSPHRGESSVMYIGGVAFAIQSFGWDASLARFGGCVAVVHGFVANWGDVARELKLDFGDHTSDAARFLVAFEKSGEQVFSGLRGEFSVVILDTKRRMVVAVRDPIGCKSLFIQKDRGRIFLATEIRQVLAGSGAGIELDEDTLVAHLAGWQPRGEATLFRGVDCVHPGDVYEYSLGQGATCERRTTYWDLESEVDTSIRSEDEWLEALTEVIEKSVARRIPRGPFAVTLSGGLDSTTVWAEVERQRAFGHLYEDSCYPISLIFPGEEYDESGFIQQTLGEASRKWLRIDGNHHRNSQHLGFLLQALDDIPFMTTYFARLISETASASGRQIVLTGHLGDHWFDICDHSNLRETMKRWAFWGTAAVIGRNTTGRVWGKAQKWMGRVPRWLDSSFHCVSHADRPRRIWCDNSLHLVRQRIARVRRDWGFTSWDAMGSRSRVEFRHPFADQDVVAHAASMPREFQKSEIHKLALRKILLGRVPDEIVQRPHKTVFDGLVRRDTGIEIDHELIASWTLARRGVVSARRIEEFLRSESRASINDVELVWLFSAELFARSLELRDRARRGRDYGSQN